MSSTLLNLSRSKQLINNGNQKIKVVECDNDLADDFLHKIKTKKLIAWDIETTGLDWRNDKIGTCQIYIPDEEVIIVKIGELRPELLLSVLSDATICKIFHHAIFDLQFMFYHWQVLPQNVACTKIASKLLDVKQEKRHSLQSLLREYLGVRLNKNKKVRVSDWLSDQLTEKQKNYAANDVVYLPLLIDTLHKELESANLLWLALNCYLHVPTRVALDTYGYEDVFSY